MAAVETVIKVGIFTILSQPLQSRLRRRRLLHFYAAIAASLPVYGMAVELAGLHVTRKGN